MRYGSPKADRPQSPGEPFEAAFERPKVRTRSKVRSSRCGPYRETADIRVSKISGNGSEACWEATCRSSAGRACGICCFALPRHEKSRVAGD